MDNTIVRKSTLNSIGGWRNEEDEVTEKLIKKRGKGEKR